MSVEILPLIDLSIVTYRSARWLPGFFASLLGQHYPLNRIRLLIRDNGSDDGSVAACQTFIDTHGSEFSGTNLEKGKNLGFGGGQNASLGRSVGDYFLVSNVDVEFQPDSLIRLVEAAQADSPQVVAWECRQLPYEHPKAYSPISGETEWVACACVLFRTPALRSVGGFDARLFMYGEDVELSWRLREAGYRLRYVPRAVVLHHAYAAPGEIKPALAVGNPLANALLRVRYGTARAALAAPAMLALRLFMPQRFPGHRRALWANFRRFLALAPGYLRERRQSELRFGFRGWDYGSLRRSGAFLAAHANDADGPLVSLLIRTFAGRSGKLAEALASVAQQTYRKLEVVVVEDGGTTMQAQVQAFAGTFPRFAVRYEAIAKGGRCASGNRALALATGEFCCFLDDDDLLYADHVETLAGTLARHPDWVAVYAAAFEVRTRVMSHEPWRYVETGFTPVFEPVFSRTRLFQRNHLPIQSVMFRRSLFQRFGGFDPELDNLEDWNLWVRYAAAGEFGAVAKTTSLFRVPASSREAHRRRVAMVRQYAEPARRKNAEAAQAVGTPMATSRASRWLRHLSVNLPGMGFLYYPCRNFMVRLRRLARRWTGST